MGNNEKDLPSKSKYLFWILFIIALGFGLILGWVDSYPAWSDKITFVAVFGLTAILGLTIPKRAWIWALLLGIWIPIWQILLYRNYVSLIAVAISFLGAYSGAFFHKQFFHNK